MNLYQLHNDPKTLKHYELSHDTVPKLILQKYGKDKNELKKREQQIIKDPVTAERYARLILHGPWKEAEDIIATDAHASYDYATEVLDGPFPKGEAAILTDDELTFFYNEDVLNGDRWPARERNILKGKHALAAANYARRIIDGPWPEAEALIATDADASFSYALDVLGKAFPAGEKAIFADDHFAKLYRDYVLDESKNKRAYIKRGSINYIPDENEK